MTRILVVDDEPKIVDMVCSYLRSESFLVEGISYPIDTFKITEQLKPDLLVLDVMMSPINGIDILKELRKKSDLPIILLTARADEADKILGLELGADDYITKPFSLRELSARIRVVLRRVAGGRSFESQIITYGNVSLDSGQMEVYCNGEYVPLTRTEFKILESLISHPGRVFTRLQLLDALGETYIGYERTLYTHVSNLRKKLEKCTDHEFQILTVYGIGYKLGGLRA
jgi:DNA-binding response OmpR family regulator